MKKETVLTVVLLSLYTLNVFSLDSLIIGNFPMGVIDSFAISKGYFTEKNLAPIFSPVQGSEQQFNSFYQGAYDLIYTASDNVLWRRLGQGRTDLVTVAQYDGSPGMAMLVNSDLGLHTLADVVGKTILTDSMQSGFITSLREFLFKANLPPLTENVMIPFGSGRNGALIAGRTNGTMSVGAPTWTVPALNPQVLVVARLEPLVCPYVGTVLTAKSSWLQNAANVNKLIRYLRAELKAWKYVTNPTNEAEVVAFIATANGVNTALAQTVFDQTIASANAGLTPYLIPILSATVNAINMRTVDLKVTAPPCIPPSGYLVSQPGGYFDISYLNTALNQELQFYNAYGIFYNNPRSHCTF